MDQHRDLPSGVRLSDHHSDAAMESDASSTGGMVGPEESGAAFPPTYIVLAFARHMNPAAILWLTNKIRGNRRKGGAELLVRRQPIKPSEGITLHVTASKIKFLEAAEEMELRKKDNAGMIREFTVSQLEDFLDEGMSVDDLLTTSERQTIVRHELENIRALSEDKHIPGFPQYKLYEGQSIVQMCLYWGLIEHLYPLHDTEFIEKFGKQWYQRAFLTEQPLDDIRLYFGDAVCLYFTFLSFYTKALVAPMILGFLQLFMPAETLAFFCIFNVIWITIFLLLWKRKCNELAFRWGTIGMTSLDEPRPNFHGQMAVDQITGKYQPQFPRWKTYARMYSVSLPIVFLCMVGAFIVMLIAFWAEEYLTQMSKPRSEYIIMLPSVIYTGLVFVMNTYYRKLATHLTEWENHRTQSQFDRHRVTKLVLFEFVNNFMSLFYIAFYYQDMEMLKMQLAIMLIILQAINNFQEAVLPLLMRYWGNKVTEFASSISLFRRNKYEIIDDTIPEKHPAADQGSFGHLLEDIPELEYDDPRIPLAKKEGDMENYEGTYDDYLELFIQFGYVFLFSSVYPMAAFWAVFNNLVEIRADAFKLCRVYQRPLTKRVKDIGAWQRSFELLGAMSIMTNCGLLCMSPQLRALAPNLDTLEWLLLFVVLEHILLAVRQILKYTISDKPEWVRVALAKMNYQSKQALKHERMLKNRRHMLVRKYRTIHGPHNKSH